MLWNCGILNFQENRVTLVFILAKTDMVAYRWKAENIVKKITLTRSLSSIFSIAIPLRSFFQGNIGDQLAIANNDRRSRSRSKDRWSVMLWFLFWSISFSMMWHSWFIIRKWRNTLYFAEPRIGRDHISFTFKRCHFSAFSCF